MIIAKNITKRFDTLQVLKGVDLHIAPREIVSIIGPSGAGKTTLLQLLGTLDKPDTGTIQIAGVDVLGLNERAIIVSWLVWFVNAFIGWAFVKALRWFFLPKWFLLNVL